MFRISVLITLLFGLHAFGQQAFEDVTDSIGLNGLGGGVAAWVDYNNDDWPDLYVSGQLWRNESGKFVAVKNHGLSGSGTWSDLNNDGFVDLFSFDVPCAVFLNNVADGDESFTKVQGGVPAELPMEVSLGAAAADFDGDGLIDIYLGGYEIWQKANYRDIILRNMGDGQFEEVWRTQGGPQPARGITACDFDEDGDVDLFVSNYRLERNILWQNDGTGKFANITSDSGLTHDGHQGRYFGHTIGSAIGDLDSDGHFDIFVGNFSHPPQWQDRPKFMQNLGPNVKFRFLDRSDVARLRWQESYASPALADYDNDGLLDLFFTTVYSGDKSVLYHNLGEWKFEEVTVESKIETAETYQAAWGDFDNDGYLDLVSGGRLFKNPGGKNDDNKWLKIRLTDPQNRPLPGAQVRIKLHDKTLTRQISCSTGQGNQNESTLHFGLGPIAEDEVEIEIKWPGGTMQSAKVRLGQCNEITRSQAGDNAQK